ncbi:MAG: RHS repeat protein, partial [Caldilineales bacterium]|nr:RHS repeat protein [Caldilineales bacterium]
MIVNRLAEEKVFDAGGACRSQRRNYYDGQASEQTPPTKGLLTKVEAAQDACGGGFVTQVQNSYDPTWHNLTRSQDGLGHGLTTVYDNEFHVFVSTQSNDLSQTTTTTYPPADVVQRALGLPSQTTDANNQVASYTYDGFGRPLTVNRPLGHASVDEQWVYTDYSSAASPRRVLHKLYDEVTTPANPESGYLAEWTFYDGLGREVQRQGEHESDANKSILVSQSYDGQGRLERTSVGYEYGGAPGTYRAVTNWNGVAHSRNEYDSLGRV